MEQIINQQDDFRNKLAKKINKIKTNANFLFEDNKYKKVLKKHKIIIKLTKDINNTYFKKIYMETLKLTGEILINHFSKPKDALSYLLKALDVYHQLESNQNLEYQLFSDLYYCFLKTGNRDKIILYGQKSIENPNISLNTKMDICANIGRSYLMKYYNISNTCFLIRAIAYSSKALELYRANCNYQKKEYYTCLYDCGEISYLLQDYDMALKYFEEIDSLSLETTIPHNILFGMYTYLTDIFHTKGYKDTEFFYEQKITMLKILDFTKKIT